MEIYATKILQDLDLKTYDKLLSKIDNAKQKKIKSCKDPQTSLQMLISDLLIRHIVKTKLELTDKKISFTTNYWGKPNLINHPEFHFNLSHCDQWIVCAIDTKPLGIDIEKIQTDISKLPLDVLSPEEKEQFYFLAPNQKASYFFKIWTRKESYLKANGTGISKDLPSITVTENPQENGVTQKYFTKEYAFENFALAVCCKHQNFAKNIFFIDNKILSSSKASK